VLIIDSGGLRARDLRFRGSILEREGWMVTEAENGRLGLESMEKVRPRLILLDLVMPEMDGFEFVDRVREKAEWA
jgi:CheY-like chemotaxis protein